MVDDSSIEGLIFEGTLTRPCGVSNASHIEVDNLERGNLVGGISNLVKDFSIVDGSSMKVIISDSTLG